MKPAEVGLIAVFAAAVAAAIFTHLAIYQPSDFFQQHFVLLLLIDGALICLLLAAVAAMLARLARQWRRGARGARLSLRLGALLSFMSLLPALLLYGVSVGAVFRGIESWFDVPLGQSFERGIAFGQVVIGREFDRLEYVARDIASGAPARRGGLAFYLNDARLLYSLEEATIYDSAGRPLVSAGDLTQQRAPPGLLGQTLEHGLHLNLQGAGVDRQLAVAVPVSLQRGATGVLRITRPLPATIAEGLLEIEQGRRQYEQLKILRRGLQWSFILTMTLSLSLILFAIGWLSVRLGKKLMTPLVRLAEAAEAVGQGDFERRLRHNEPIEEMALINRSFNNMVSDLRAARLEAQEREAAVKKINAYLANLLSSLTTGVLAFDSQGLFSDYNAAAERFLGQPLQPWVGGARLPEGQLADTALAAAAAALVAAPGASDDGEERIRLPDGGVILLRALRLPASAGGGVLAMIDDITRQIRAEREATWEEASRRFVHEIKNPLTPIQLAAERLDKKLTGKLSETDAGMLTRLVEMIVNQVGAMRQMVDSFRDYADKRRAPHDAVRLNDLLGQVLYFYADAGAKMHCDLSPDNPLALGNAVTLRQLLHNVIGNALDAVAGRADARIDIATRAADGMALLQVQDNGGGVPPDLLDKLCEPYVTSKRDGTGLGLAVVRKTVDEHNGKLRLDNADGGLRVRVWLPLAGSAPASGAAGAKKKTAHRVK